MKLLVNLSPLTPPLTGVGHYTKEILKRIINRSEISDIQGFIHHKWLSKNDILVLLDGTNSESKQDDRKVSVKSPTLLLKTMAKRIPFARNIASHLIALKFKKKISSMTDYVYWEPNFSPLFNMRKCCITVYDLSFIRHPEFHPKSRVAALTDGVRKGIENGASIITISKFSKQEIIDVYELDSKKIYIVPPGTSDKFAKADKLSIKNIKQKYSIEENYILSVCTVEPRKNLINVCRAYKLLDDSIKAKYKLVLAGKNGWLNDELENIVRPLEQSGYIQRIGYVDDDDLAPLYSGASLFVYLSVYEGYGMPIAESIKCGTPVLTSDMEPMSSVGGDTAFYANPTDYVEISNKIKYILSPNEALQSGNKKPCIYNWDESAETMLNVLSHVDRGLTI